MTEVEKRIVKETIRHLENYRDMCISVDLALKGRRTDRLHEAVLLLQKDQGNPAALVIDVLERLVAAK